MMLERQPTYYMNRLFGDVVSQDGNLAIARLMAWSGSAIDASHHGRGVTFLSDASISRGKA